VDEKNKNQAQDRAPPTLRIGLDNMAGVTRDDRNHDTATLFTDRSAAYGGVRSS
jgi:hypothetical protein